MPSPADEERARESARILERVKREQENVLTSSMARASDHFGAKDADPDDKVELWGRRIGRSLSLVAVIVLAYTLGRQLGFWWDLLATGESSETDAEPLAALKAPTLADIERLADAAFAALPEVFRTMCGAAVFRVEDFPSEDVLREMECDSAFDLLGLFTGIGLAQGPAVSETGQLPNIIHLYRRPLLDYWAEHDETLGHLVAHVLIHEIGHHFGLSDDDIDAIEAAAE